MSTRTTSIRRAREADLGSLSTVFDASWREAYRGIIPGVALERLIAAGDPVHYEVFEKVIPETYGHLLFCISKLFPGRVGDECFMTKGHYHTVSGTAETYLCIAGTGFMMCKLADNAWRAEPMRRNRMVYVPPHWGHRSINTGPEPLISFCVYPAEAGHNYGDIAALGFPRRVFIRNGREVFE